MADREYSDIAQLASVVKTGIESALMNVHTAVPGKIVSFDAALQTASVQPLVKRVFKENDGETETLVDVDLPVCINVPVHFPGGGGYHLTFPIAPGDECILIFAERAIDVWHQTGQSRKPNARRFHSLSDGMCLVGIDSIPNKITGFSDTDVELRNSAGTQKIILEESGNIALETLGDLTATALNVDITATGQIDLTAPTINLNGIVNVSGMLNATGGFAASGGSGTASITGNVSITGTSTATDHISGGKSGATHTHNENGDGGGVTDPPN